MFLTLLLDLEVQSVLGFLSFLFLVGLVIKLCFLVIHHMVQGFFCSLVYLLGIHLVVVFFLDAELFFSLESQ